MFGTLLVALDPVGNVRLVLQVTILFLLVLGLPFVRDKTNKKNPMWHGYSTMLALVLHAILTLLVMIPVLENGVREFASLSLFYSLTVRSHVMLGSTARALGIILVST